MTAHFPEKERFAPFLQLLIVFGLILISAGIFSYIGAFLAVQIFDIDSIQTFTSSFENQLKYPDALIFYQGFTAMGTFLLPAIFFSLVIGQHPVRFFTLNKSTSILLVGLAVMILLFGQGVVNISAYLNQQFIFPDWLKGVGEWMSEMNAKVDEGYKVFLDIQTVPKLLAMLLVAGLIPAFGEEMLFRGVLQRIFHNWTGKGHLAVWIAAFIFSIIHFQVFNFLPRLFLGAMLGYLFLWSGNLWYSIAAHLFNNAALLIYAYFHIRQGGDISELQSGGEIQWLPMIFATLVFFGLLLFFRNRAKEKVTDEETK